MKRVADSLFERVRKREEPREIGGRPGLLGAAASFAPFARPAVRSAVRRKDGGFDAVFFSERRVCDAVFDVFALGFFKFVNNVSPLSLCCVRFPNSVFKFFDNVRLAVCVASLFRSFFQKR